MHPGHPNKGGVLFFATLALMRVFLVLLILSLYIPLFSSPILAQVVINEISPTGDPEWVELYNYSDQMVDLEGWEVADNQTGQFHFGITLHTTLAPHQFLVIESPTGKTLTDDGDTLSLYDPEAKIHDGPITYETTKKGKTHSRLPDGTGLFVANTEPSPNSYNQPPTKTPTPSPTSTQTPSPTSTPTTQDTTTPSPSIKKTSTPAETDTVTISETEHPTLVLGESTSPTPDEEVGPNSQESSQPIIPIVVTSIGILILVSTTSFFTYRHYYASKRSKIPPSDL